MKSKGLARVAAPLVSMFLLLAPALWTGFPLLDYDTGGYLARWYEGTLEVSRSTAYGLFLVALARPDFWPAVGVQAALAVWVIALILRAHRLGGRPLLLLLTVALLSVVTTLPWIAGILLTDIFAGLSVLALYLIVLRADTLKAWERAALLVLIAFSAATHSATLAVLAGLLVVGLVIALVSRRLVPLAGLGRSVAAVVLGTVMLLAANYAVAGRLAWTPGGVALAFDPRDVSCSFDVDADRSPRRRHRVAASARTDRRRQHRHVAASDRGRQPGVEPPLVSMLAAPPSPPPPRPSGRSIASSPWWHTSYPSAICEYYQKWLSCKSIREQRASGNSACRNSPSSGCSASRSARAPR